MVIPRGISNNNPGNIERNNIEWDGMSDDQRGDDRFCVFDTAEYGIRALCRVLLTYQRKHHLKTVRAMMERWAPPHENDTEAYIRHVAAHMGVGPTQEVQLEDGLFRMGLMAEAIIKHENGEQPYEEETILAGARMAL